LAGILATGAPFDQRLE